MKKHHSFLITAIISIASFYACGGSDNDNDSSDGYRPEGSGLVNFNVTVNDYQNGTYNLWVFQTSDEMGIYAVEPLGNINLQEQGNYADNSRYQWNGNSFSPVWNPISKTYDKQLAYYAIFPYISSTGPQIDFTVNANQTTSDQIKKSDFCTAFTSLTQSMSVPMTMKHRMSRVCVKITGNTLEGHVSKVTLKDVWLTLSANLNNDTYVSATKEQGSIKMYRENDDNNTYYAIFPPQTLYASRIFLTATVDGKEMDVTFSADENFTSGIEKTLTIYRKSDSPSGLVGFDGQIAPWGQE